MDIFNCMDTATAALIIQLQIQDSDELFEGLSGKGKTRDGVFSDSQIAARLYKEDLERNASIVADRRMTISIATACHTDGQLLTASLSQEQSAASDREAACRLAGVPVPEPVAPWTVSSEFLDGEVMAKLAALFVSKPIQDDSISEGNTSVFHITEGSWDGGQAESSSWAASRNPPKALKRQCTACQDSFIYCELARTPCKHEYCRDCIRDLFQASLTDDTLFPPRCCKQPITFGGGVRIHLTSALVQSFESKKIEFDTPDRTYCSNQLCSAFIRVENISKEKATCHDCSTVTCTICKSESHLGDCPADAGLQQVLVAAEEHGWQRCFNCRRVIELEVGCNHITCKCGSQFCYLCGEQWKACRCATWDENRLLARANVVAARRPVADPPRQAARVQDAVQNLRQRHLCDHQSWQYVRGPHQCEECRHQLPSYIFECRQCNIQACNRCKLNRL
ncbi:hypothetical protein DL98DRAFT_135935 [Cadophora sp. DSE1049]|nr:hypothetical protein DL98DRAFT_135935 [Cadophora sp. DSE1049]